MRVWHYMDESGEQYFTTEKRAREAHAADTTAISEPKEINFPNRRSLVQYLNIMLGGG